jgi:acetyl esterase/lipase
MKTITIATVMCCAAVFAKPNKNTYPIWPEGRIPLAVTNMPPEMVRPTSDDIVRFTNVSYPTITFVKALSEDPAPAVLVCPGGGYSHLAWSHEGVETAQWFKNRGVSAFILKYRCPGQRDAALADAQRALSFIRANAVNFNIDPQKLGMIGYSAGANLTVRASTLHAKRIYASVDDTDKASCRPDWAMVIYPWDLLEKTPKGIIPPLKLRDEYPVDAATTPAFIVQSQDDSCLVQNALAYFNALTLAGVEAEMHLYSKGGHGYGMRERGNPTDYWPAVAELWLASKISSR